MTDSGQWNQCPDGTLSGLASRLRAQRRSAQLRPVIAGAVLLLVVCGSYVLTNNLLADSDPLTCAETVPLLAEYQSGSLKSSTERRVRDHLASCPSCRKHYQDEFPDEARRKNVGRDLVLTGTIHARFSWR